LTLLIRYLDQKAPVANFPLSDQHEEDIKGEAGERSTYPVIHQAPDVLKEVSMKHT
jgi:hypothetical protein